jgi:alkane 1-monooxygenase
MNIANSRPPVLIWFMACLTPLVGAIAPIAWWFGSQHWGWFVLPLITFYGVVPLLDRLIGDAPDDGHQIDLRAAANMKAFDWALYIGVLVVLFVFFSNLVLIGSQSLAWYEIVLSILATGVALGFGLTISHDLGHKHFWFKRKLALFTAALSGYGHFSIEHNHGHHRNVATPIDSASSRMGESIWAFLPREMLGAWTRAWIVETARLNKLGFSRMTWRNEILQGLAFTSVVVAGLVFAYGWKMIPVMLCVAFWGGFQLTSANYVEHYGLVRQQVNGQYEPCKPHHSWNSNHWVSNLILFQLQRHSDHHTYPARPYQALRSYRDVPTLPSGYFAMFLLAYVPPLWFAVMDKRLLAAVDGDASKVNFHLPSKNQLMARHFAAA